MSSEYGKILTLSVFGESHGKAVGVVINGLPPGEPVDPEELQRFLARRRPGRGPLTTSRREEDLPVFLSGFKDGKTCGTPLCATIENKDMRSRDYKELAHKPRPSHGDYTAFVKYKGAADMRGGGHFSGRLTAPLCIAGGIAKQILARRGIHLGAHLASVGRIQDVSFPLHPSRELLASLGEKEFPVLDDRRGSAMISAIEEVARDKDSLGGVVECAVIGLPAGLGGPLFSGLEGRLALPLFGIPAVKGVEFGSGFAGSALRGSEHNDPFLLLEGEVKTATNNHGGILGGISSGMPLQLNVAIKPTPSIGQPQQTLDLAHMSPTLLSIEGRHDPCIALRAVPVVEAVVATVLLDILLEENINGSF